MDGNLEFRVLVAYLGAMYFFPVIFWRKARLSPEVVGARGPHQRRARLVATALLVVPQLIFVLGDPWPWYGYLGWPEILRWSAAVPATLAILFFVWACRETVGAWGTSKNQPSENQPGETTPSESTPSAGMLGAGMPSEREPHREPSDRLDGRPFIHTGPYRSIRHPQLLASSIFFMALAIVASNAIVLISTMVGVVLLRLVVAPAVDADLAAVYGAAYEAYRQRTGSFFLRLRRVPKAQYTVPRRFGLSAVLALTTIFAFLFGALNFMRAPPPVYLFVATEISAICLVQIFFGSAPRSGSAIIGAILLPFWTAIAFASDLDQLSGLQQAIGGLCLMVVGAFVGYCIGTLAAGFFLAMDLLEPYLPGAKSDSLRPMGTNPDQKPSP